MPLQHVVATTMQRATHSRKWIDPKRPVLCRVIGKANRFGSIAAHLCTALHRTVAQVHGLSSGMFVVTVMGNMLYGTP